MITAPQLSIEGTTPIVRLGDGIAGLMALEAGSVDLVLSDLPNGETAAVFDEAPPLDALWSATWHALKPNGIAVFMASSLRFALSLVLSQSRAFRYDLIWEKSIATGFLNSKYRPLRNHEFILVFWRGKEPAFHRQMLETGVRINRNGDRGSRGSENYGNGGRGKGISRFGATDRYPRSVLKFRSVHVRDPHRTHPQQKPADLFAYLVRTYSAPGDLVCDPMAGAGTTGSACIATGRRYLCWDSDPRFGVTP
jgi:site-specific DNA-methyltransferase (adenine-specific)